MFFSLLRESAIPEVADSGVSVLEALVDLGVVHSMVVEDLLREV